MVVQTGVQCQGWHPSVINKGDGTGKENAFMSGCSCLQCSIVPVGGVELENVVTKLSENLIVFCLVCEMYESFRLSRGVHWPYCSLWSVPDLFHGCSKSHCDRSARDGFNDSSVELY